MMGNYGGDRVKEWHVTKLAGRQLGLLKPLDTTAPQSCIFIAVLKLYHLTCSW